MVNPVTLVRVGRFYDNLELRMIEFCSDYESIKLPNSNILKFAVYRETPMQYLLVLSQRTDNLLSVGGYNTMLTITSESLDFNLGLEERFFRETGFKLRNPLFNTAAMAEGLNRAFLVFQQHGRSAMDLFVERRRDF